MLFYLLFIAAFIALLLFVSSRIRRAANDAYEPEQIERENFTIFKPEGYLNPVDWTAAIPFVAYSRELGERSAGRLRKSNAKLEVSDGLNFDKLRKEFKTDAQIFVSTVFDENAPDGQRICLVETKKKEASEITTVFFNKIVESRPNKKTFNLEISILEDHRDEFEERINLMLDSFKVN